MVTKFSIPLFSFSNEKSIEIYKISTEFLNSTDFLRDLTNSSRGLAISEKLVPQTTENMFSGHFFPILESCHEVQISFNLCLFGFYKQSMASLRVGLELALLSIYWNLNDDGHETITSWLKARENTPRFNEVWKLISKHKNFQYFDQKHSLHDILLSFGYLHDFVHSKGYKHSNRNGKTIINSQQFQESKITQWMRSFKEVVKLIVLIHLIKYPIGIFEYDYYSKFGIDIPGFGGLMSDEIRVVENIISNDYLNTIKEMLKQDLTAQGIVNWVKELPIKTEKDLENQLFEIEKFSVNGIGFNAWLEQMKNLYGSEVDSIRFSNVIRRLKEWAIESGNFDPKFPNL